MAEKEERTTENKMERRVSTRFEKYWTESGRGDRQGDVEKKDHQLYRRPYMMGKARGKEEDTYGRNEILSTKNNEFNSAAIFPVWHELSMLRYGLVNVAGIRRWQET